MRLKTNIFLWVSLATVLPLTIIVLLATAYSEHAHREDVDERVNASLNYIVAEFDRRLGYEREVITALAVSPPMERFRPILEAAIEGRRHPEFGPRADQLASFLEELQWVLRDVGTIRVLNAQGNTLVKVRFGSRSPPSYSGIEAYPYVEAELDDESLREALFTMPAGEVNYILLPPTLSEFGESGPGPMLDAAVPVPTLAARAPGYLVVNSTGAQIDRILSLAPRIYNGSLLIGEINPDEPERDGMILYNDQDAFIFTTPKNRDYDFKQAFEGQLWELVQSQPYGAFDIEDGRARVYYIEYHPYPKQLSSWVIALRIDTEEITGPFAGIRAGILLFATVALVMTLLLAQLGARRIAEPISALAQSLKAYAKGRRAALPPAAATEEIKGLHEAFNYMADTLEEARIERDHAQTMMLQSAKLASIGEMAAGIGHEINNPLHNILTLAKLIQRQVPEDDEALQGDLKALSDEALRASRIVRGILNFARQLPPDYARFEVGPWLENTLQLVAQAAREHEVALQLDAAPGLTLEGDANQLQQVMINLILNAVQASRPGEQVRIDARATDAAQVLIEVSDAGTGIETGIMDKLFDPFFTTKPSGKGSGLGLSVSLGIVEHHGGDIDVRNNERGGVTVSVRLPIERVTPSE